ncbi:hypothetical protein K461DRAFT_281166 [Myriangium duriaei CBS 260.36]|uniref:gamma-glutamylcyclotransferase n=1 Tax=Myriangium duriaei CBS 260.36 TaxID=1168546 RepID=A0A9P4ITX7_9PEZI|nr:hypothetical protein K461DRAFT_281166 [Myriangium duriaei CBS 260.36]
MHILPSLVLQGLLQISNMGSIAPKQVPVALDQEGPIYFGYGSNLWKHQMEMRCPDSKYIGLARLNGYRWHINDRHYANVAEVNASDSSDSSKTHSFGLVYALSETDEAALDINEGVPFAYTKEHLEVDFWPLGDGKEPIDIEQPVTKVKMLVYINRNMTTDSSPKKEYIYRMNKGIDDAEAAGVPKTYIDQTIRKFIPAEHDESAERLAKQQALNFVEEN